MSAVECPEFASWTGLLDDTLPPNARAQYERHLESCPLCQDQLDRCDDCEEAWRQVAQQIGDPTTLPTDPTLTVVIQRWCRKGEGPSEPDVLPAQAIAPSDGGLAWLVDAAAAAQLQAERR